MHEEVERQLNIDFAERLTAAVTTDGQHIEVFANVNRVTDAEQAVEYGAEGVGLMRTEFLFLESGETPSEEEQYQVYCDMARALQGRPLTIQRAMHHILAKLVGKICLVYIDDVIVFGKDEEKHNKNLETVLQRLTEFNVKRNAKLDLRRQDF